MAGRPKKTEEKIDRRITFLVQESFYNKMEEDRKRKNKLSMSAYVLAAVEEYMKRDTN